MTGHVLLAAVSFALFALPAQAQYAPSVPQYRCNNPPRNTFLNEGRQLAIGYGVSPLQIELLALTYANAAVDSWTRACQQSYSAAMLQWQAEMQRIESLQRQRILNRN